MHTETINGNKHLILNPQTESCPLCDTPIKDSYCHWNIFHGEVTYECCNMVCQIKSYHVDESKPEERAYAESLDDPSKIEFCIDEEYIPLLRQAFAETGIKDCKNDTVYEAFKKLKEATSATMLKERER